MIRLSSITDEELLQIVQGARKFEGAYLKLVIPMQLPTLQDSTSEEDKNTASDEYADQDVCNFTEVQTSPEMKETETYQPNEHICDITDMQEESTKQSIDGDETHAELIQKKKQTSSVQLSALHDSVSEEDKEIVSEEHTTGQDDCNLTDVQTSPVLKETNQSNEGISDATKVRKSRKRTNNIGDDAKLIRKRKRTCFTCQNVYSNYEECAIHYFNTHVLPKYVDVCKGVKDPTKYYCGEDNCFASFQDPLAFWDHTLGHTNIFKHACPEENCNMTFPSRRLLYIHKGKCHTATKMLCVQCGATFTARSSLTVHMKRHEGIKPFQCSLCGKCFVTKCGLDRHSQSHGDKSKNQATHQCDSCGGTYLSIRSLRRHKAVMHDNSTKAHECDVCGKSFSLEPSLKRHMKIHTGEKPYECTLCKFSFTEKHSLTRHQKALHNMSSIDIKIHNGEDH